MHVSAGRASTIPPRDREIDGLLVPALPGPSVAKSTRSPLVEPSAMIQVPIVAIKNDAIVVLGSINTRPVIFEVDSGASLVSIPLPIAKKLDLGSPIDVAHVEFADGRTDDHLVYQIASLRIGDTEIHDVLAAVGGNGETILLGRAALNKFTGWAVDTKHGMLLLRP